jgi:branched-subunit amino acid ABC-type transport system permease component
MQVPAYITYTIIYACQLSFLSFSFSLNHITDDFPNFSQAGIISTGIVLNYHLTTQLQVSPYFGSVLAFLIGGILGLITHSLFRYLERKGRDDIQLTLVSLGSMIVLTNFSKIWQFWIRDLYPTVDFAFLLRRYDFTFLQNPGIFYGSMLFFILATVTLLTFPRLDVSALFTALCENRVLAEIQGINVSYVRRLCWFFTGGVSCFTGALFVINFHASPDGAYFLLIAAIAGSLLGGISHLRASFFGGFVMGFLEMGSIMVAQWLLGPWIGEYRPLVPILVLSMFLRFKSDGILHE